MIYRLALAFAFSAHASESSLILTGKYRDANQAFERMELREYVQPGLTGARILEILTTRFPADRDFLKREIPAETSRLRAIERVSADRYQITTLNGRTFALTPGPRPLTVKIDGKIVRLANAPQFLADMRLAAAAGFATGWLGLFTPDRAEAALPIAATILLAVVLSAYATWSSYKDGKKPTTEDYLTQLTSECRNDRDGDTPFETSRTALRLQASIDNKIMPASLTKTDCPSYVKKMVATLPAEQIRAGDPKRTCEQLEAYRDCLELYKLRPQPGGVQRANGDDSTSGR